MRFSRIVDQLPIDKHLLDDALETQASTQYEISSEVAKHGEIVSGLKDDLKVLEADLAQTFFDSAVKQTVKQIESEVLLDSERIQLSKDLRSAQLELERWQGLLDAWRQRGFALKVLADLHSTDYFSPSSTTSPERVSQRKQQITEKRNRARLEG